MYQYYRFKNWFERRAHPPSTHPKAKKNKQIRLHKIAMQALESKCCWAWAWGWEGEKVLAFSTAIESKAAEVTAEEWVQPVHSEVNL